MDADSTYSLSMQNLNLKLYIYAYVCVFLSVCMNEDRVLREVGMRGSNGKHKIKKKWELTKEQEICERRGNMGRGVGMKMNKNKIK